MAAVDVRRIKLWQDRIDTEVEIAGEGPPLVYLHGPWGLAPDRAFVARLAECHQVFAPKFPGTSAGDPNSVQALDGWHDLVVYTGELFDRLGLSSPALVGHSFGALLAAEFAAAAPQRGRPARTDRSSRPVARRSSGEKLDDLERRRAQGFAVRRARR